MSPRAKRQDFQEVLRAEVRRLPFSAEGKLRLLVAYPNEYRVGMANLGLHAVLETALLHGAIVDRLFLPDSVGGLESKRRALTSLESRRPLGSFHALLFSISFEPDYVGLIQLLELGGLEPLASRRSASDPLVVAGGLAPTLNPEPIAEFCDLIGIGEAEAILSPFFDLLDEELPKQELLARAVKLPGWYVPSMGPHPVARQSSTLSRPCCPVILSSCAAFSEHVDLEISRGCRWRCRFCASGHVVRPYRELGLDQLKEAIHWGLSQHGRVGLVGTDVSDHEHLEEIVEHVWNQGGEVALPSLRVESLHRRTGVVARLIGQKPPRTLTLAVEASSESLRRGLGKRLSQEHIFRAAENAKAAGVHRLRLYFLVGCPGERWEEVEGIAELCSELRPRAPSGGMTLSVNGLVPKAGTPLQWEAPPGKVYLRRARNFLRAALAKVGVELVFESPDWTRWQALLSLAGREASEIILEASRDGWRRALSRAEAELEILGERGRSLERDLPWSHVDYGVPLEILRKERQRCLNREYTPPERIER